MTNFSPLGRFPIKREIYTAGGSKSDGVCPANGLAEQRDPLEKPFRASPGDNGRV